VSIAIDWEEFISIFANGRGVPGMGPLPPGIFGYRRRSRRLQPGRLRLDRGRSVRKPIQAARKLLVEAGYPDGRDARTGQPLVLYLDTTARGAEDAAQLAWYRQAVRQIDVQLEIRSTDWNRFQEKIRLGNTQMFFLGWTRLSRPRELHVPAVWAERHAGRREQGALREPRVRPAVRADEEHGQRPAASGDHRPVVKIAREDAPWAWGLHPKVYSLRNVWVRPGKPNVITRNTLKYIRINPELRDRKREEWKPPGSMAARHDPRRAAARKRAGLSQLPPARAHGGEARGGACVIAYIVRRILYVVPILILVNCSRSGCSSR